MEYNFNATSYLANQQNPPNQNNFSVVTTLKEINETINKRYNWSNVVITDTSSNIAIFLQGIEVNHTCPDCFPNIVQINSSCGSNDLLNITYNDTSQCIDAVLPPNSTASCDFCTQNFQCNSYVPSTCGIDMKFRECQSVADTNNCFNQTGLPSDSFIGDVDDFDALCTFGDFKLNSTLFSSLATQLIISQYPYVEVNTTINMETIVTLADTRVLISNVQMQILNETIPFTQDNDSVSYKRSIQIHEVGDFPFVVVGRDNVSQVFRIEGVFFARQFVDVSVELFEDRNLSDRYENDLAEVIAIRNLESPPSDFEGDLIGSIQPLIKTNLFTRKLIKLNTSTYYDYKFNKRAFHSPYREGIAVLRLPVEDTTIWELRLLNMEKSNEYVFDEFNWAKIQTYDVVGANDVKLTSGKILTDLEVKLLVSKWDVRFFASALKWVIFGVIAIALGIIAYFLYVSTEDPAIVVKFLIALLVALPTLYIILTWLFN